MTETWYSKKLIVGRPVERDALVPDFVRPLVQTLEGKGLRFRFHFFRYSGPPPYLRLRVRGDEPVLQEVERYERASLSRLGAHAEEEPYDVSSEMRSPFHSEEEVEKAWRIYEVASRIAMECGSDGFPPERLRGDYGIGVKLNHLFLNSIGYAVDEEYNVHRAALHDRAVVLLMIKHNLPDSEVLSRFSGRLIDFDRALDQATDILSRVLG